MQIYIDITRLTCQGKAVAYDAEVHYEMDDQDTIDRRDMDELKRRIQYEVGRTLSLANERKPTPRTEY